MSTPVIRIENLSKQYRLGVVSTGTISHDLNRWWHRLRGEEDPYLKIEATRGQEMAKTDYVWALKDVDIEVAKGEVVGIIGRNGAGKSTLLKILSRVTGPTSGRVLAKGRIGSLLEVGTGFHPELTGRENIFLNGAILGMRKAEISSKLDEIIDFSGVELYIDTPVKRYSSGMKVRLAFAVAAHLEPEILVIDEVLAVGDVEFQKKALGKMESVSRDFGRTILFVSHNMAAVRNLCNRAVLLVDGRLTLSSTTAHVVSEYLGGGTNGNSVSFMNGNQPECAVLKLLKAQLRVASKSHEVPLTMADPIECIIVLDLKDGHSSTDLNVVLQFKDDQGRYLFVTGGRIPKSSQPGLIKAVVLIPPNFFNSGAFSVNVNFVDDGHTILRNSDLLSFSVVHKTTPEGKWLGTSKGPLKPKFNWEFSQL